MRPRPALQLTFDDPVLPYPMLPHKTVWPGCALSEEYLVPDDHKARLLEELYPYADVPSMDTMLYDLHAKQVFVVREFKVVREQGMNMLVSPYYYQAGGSVIDWMPANPPSPMRDFEGDDGDGDDDLGDELFGPITVLAIRPGAEKRLTGLMLRQHEGPAFPSTADRRFAN